MFDLILENKHGDKLTFDQNSPFKITEIEGLNPAPATVNTSELSLMDGGLFVSSKVQMRTMNVAFAIEKETAKNRIEVFKVLKSKQWIKCYYNGQYRQVFIEGYIERIDIDYFEMVQVVTCQILCPDPFWKDAQEIVDELSTIISDFHFPFASTSTPELVFSHVSTNGSITINNTGDVDCGMIIDLYAIDDVADPKIWNYETQEFFGLDVGMDAHDLIRIDTRRGHFSVTGFRNDQKYNLFDRVIQNSTWLQLPAGSGTFFYELGTGSTSDLQVTITHSNLYEGV